MIPDEFKNPITFMELLGYQQDYLNHCQHGIFIGQCPRCTQTEADKIMEGLRYGVGD